MPQPSKEQPRVQMFAPEIILLVHSLCPACLDRERAGGAWSSLTSPATQDYQPHFTAEHISASSNPFPHSITRPATNDTNMWNGSKMIFLEVF